MSPAISLQCHCGARTTADSDQPGEIVDYLDTSKDPPVASSATHFLEGPMRGWIHLHSGGAYCPAHGEVIRKNRI